MLSAGPNVPLSVAATRIISTLHPDWASPEAHTSTPFLSCGEGGGGDSGKNVKVIKIKQGFSFQQVLPRTRGHHFVNEELEMTDFWANEGKTIEVNKEVFLK